MEEGVFSSSPFFSDGRDFTKNPRSWTFTIVEDDDYPGLEDIINQVKQESSGSYNKDYRPGSPVVDRIVHRNRISSEDVDFVSENCECLSGDSSISESPGVDLTQESSPIAEVFLPFSGKSTLPEENYVDMEQETLAITTDRFLNFTGNLNIPVGMEVTQESSPIVVDENLDFPETMNKTESTAISATKESSSIAACGFLHFSENDNISETAEIDTAIESSSIATDDFLHSTEDANQSETHCINTAQELSSVVTYNSPSNAMESSSDDDDDDLDDTCESELEQKERNICYKCGVEFRTEYLLRHHKFRCAFIGQPVVKTFDNKPANKPVNKKQTARKQTYKGKQAENVSLINSTLPVAESHHPFGVSLIKGHNINKCPYCSLPFNNTAEIISHCKIEHKNDYNKRENKCKFCFHTFARMQNLIRHVRSHTGETPWFCRSCGKRFKERSVCKIHWMKCRKVSPKGLLLSEYKEDSNKSKWNPVILLERINVQALEEHTNIDEDVKLRPIGYSDDFSETATTIRTTSEAATTIRTTSAAAMTLTTTIIDPLSCKQCNKRFRTVVGLQNHLNLHSNTQKKHTCPECGKAFPYRYLLSRHMKRYEESTITLKADDMEKGDSNNQIRKKCPVENSNLWEHVCRECGKSFQYPSELKRHSVKHKKRVIRRHTSTLDRSGQLGKNTITLKNSKRVIQKGKGHRLNLFSNLNRKHVCRECGKSFEFPSKLIRHLKTHRSKVDRSDHLQSLGANLLKCCYCIKKFRTYETLEKHTRIHTSLDRKSVCNICGYRFMRNKYLQAHYKNVHLKRTAKVVVTDSQEDLPQGDSNYQKVLQTRSPSKVESNNQAALQTFESNCQIPLTANSPYDGKLICHHCNKTFKFSFTLHRHLKLTHANDISHTGQKRDSVESIQKSGETSLEHNQTPQCEFCSKQFLTKQGCQRHKTLFCPVTTANKRPTVEVLKKVEEVKPTNPEHNFQCGFCDKQLSSKNSLRRHKKLSCHVKSKNRKYTILESVRKFKRKKPTNLKNGQTFQCEFCDKQYMWEKSLRKHKKTDCFNAATNKTRTGVGDSKKPEGTKQINLEYMQTFQCEFCDKKFSSRDSLRRHKKKVCFNTATNKTCTGVGDSNKAEEMKATNLQHRLTFQCERCNKHLSSKDALQRHTKLSCLIKRKNRKNTTVESVRKFRRKNPTKLKHVQAFQCEYCGAKVGTLQGYKRHKKIHCPVTTAGKDRCFRCIACARPYKSSEARRRHQKICRFNLSGKSTRDEAIKTEINADNGQTRRECLEFISNTASEYKYKRKYSNTIKSPPLKVGPGRRPTIPCNHCDSKLAGSFYFHHVLKHYVGELSSMDLPIVSEISDEYVVKDLVEGLCDKVVETVDSHQSSDINVQVCSPSSMENLDGEDLFMHSYLSSIHNNKDDANVALPTPLKDSEENFDITSKLKAISVIIMRSNALRGNKTGLEYCSQTVTNNCSKDNDIHKSDRDNDTHINDNTNDNDIHKNDRDNDTHTINDNTNDNDIHESDRDDDTHTNENTNDGNTDSNNDKKCKIKRRNKNIDVTTSDVQSVGSPKKKIRRSVRKFDSVHKKFMPKIILKETIPSLKSRGKRNTKKMDSLLHEKSNQNTTSGRLSCKDCGKKFQYAIEAKSHSCGKVSKPFVCMTCGRRFSQKPHLATHNYIHTGEKPFPCPLCNKAYRQPIHRTNHMKSMHPIDSNLFRCGTCGETFRDRPDFLIHKKIHRK